MVDGSAPVDRLRMGAAVEVFADMTLRTAAEILTKEVIGAAVVRGEQGLHAVLSERDIVRAIAEGRSLDDTTVGEVMSTGVVTAAPSEPVLRVARRMIENDVRHVVIVDGTKVTGMVSMRDVLRALA